MLKLGWLWPGSTLLAVSLGACSGDYPLPPTLCDDFCDATQGSLLCSDYDPALCVAQCETEDVSRSACRPELEALLDCFHSKPNAISDQCRYDPFGMPLGCQAPATLLYFCIDATNEPGHIGGLR